MSISTRESGAETEEARRRRDARDAALAAAGEVLTVPPRATALGWLSVAGWTVAEGAVHDSGEGRLLGRATR